MKIMSKMMCVILILHLLVACAKNEEAVFFKINTTEYEELTETQLDNRIKEISHYLRETCNIKGNIEEAIEIDVIEIGSQFSEEEIDLVHIDLDYAWINGYIIYEDDKIVGLMTGMSDDGLYITDLNHDGDKEVLFKTTIGSGFVRTVFIAYDLTSNKAYSVSYYDGEESQLIEENERVAVHSYDYTLDKISEEPIGYLELTEEGLNIDGVDASDLEFSVGNKKIEANGIVEFVGEGQYWDVVYIYDSDRYEEKKVNYFKIVNKEKDTVVKLEDIDITIQSDDGVITGNVGAMDVKEKMNQQGFQEIIFLVGTVNHITYLQDKYTITIAFNDKEDIVNLKYEN